MSTFPTQAAMTWPGDVPRIARDAMAACVEHVGSRARHARATRRQIRRAIIREVTSPANVKAVREQEHDRDLFAMHYAIGAL